MPQTPLHLRADGVSVSFGDRRVLTDITLSVPAQRPTGLLGENGSGKSTLLRVLAGRLRPDAGSVAVPGPIGLLDQEIPFPPETTVAQVIADALESARRLERELQAAGDALVDGDAAAAAVYDDVLARAVLADVWGAPARAEQVMTGLALQDVDRSRRLDEVSGGQRGRLALARLLIARPTTLLLDEPTNHLDDDGAAFLTGMLAEHPGPVLVASHDRAFLDDATRVQLDLDPAPSPLDAEPGGVTAYEGGFSDYLLARYDARDRWARQHRDEQEELDRLRVQVRESHSVGHEGRGPRTEARASKKFYADRNAAVVSRRVRDAQRRLEELERTQIRRPPAPLALSHLPTAEGRRGGVLLAASEVAVRGRLAPTSVALSSGEKLLVTGPNGGGKSTFLHTLAGRLEPTGGSVSRPRGARVALLEQDTPVPEGTVRQVLARAAGVPEADHEPELFGLVHPRDLVRPVAELSRGQQRRVELAALLADPPELLILDEPTNHLALEIATQLEDAIGRWDGTVVIASHDRWLRRRWEGRVLELG
ncbi:ABC transporter ATP-binding protein [Brachybacterium phenoliresistens]|uniref:ABC transporter ATP-binding protein n=1 Tax=Brachybacterium phenoliresistens TaxID=396014 RepID=Z9JS72_9MICO|nr:ABC-F family ATP-binding cassette domain-containing protein [Brachybacterium phenoliresistens]EWS81014.1 ABC transporter ATP-binding protein [Brachybacterium phenoliresistens]